MMLLDTSVWWWRSRSPEVQTRVEQLVLTGAAATCHPVMLELLYSTRNAAEFRFVREGLEALRMLPIGASEWTRALETYEVLAAQGGAHQRSVKHFDLLAAAAAESAGVEVLHYDEDFDRIAAITGQSTRWVAPRGSLG
jgi:predicted nucleic acid-binding protein